MEQARLIQRLKKQYGIKRGNPHQEVNSDKMSELTLMAGVANERQAQRLNQLNALIPPLQATAFPPLKKDLALAHMGVGATPISKG